MVETKHRHLSLGFEPGPTLENGPFVYDAKTAVAGPDPVDRNISRPGPLEVILNGGTDNTGTVKVKGVINGDLFEEDFVFTGPGGGEVRLQGLLEFETVTEVETTGLTTEGAVPTVAVRTAPRVDIDYMTESIKGNKNWVTDEGHVAERHVEVIEPGKYSLGGDFDTNARPDAGLGEILTAAYGEPTTLYEAGDVIEAGANELLVAPSASITGAPRRLAVGVTAVTGSGSLQINGLINGSPSSEIIPISTSGVVILSLKAFDSITSYVHTGYTALTWDLNQAVAFRHRWTPKDEIPSFFLRKGLDGLGVRENQGLRVEKLELGLKTNAFIMLKITTKGRQDVELLVEVPAFNKKKPFVFHRTTVKRDGVAYNLIIESVLTEGNTLAVREAQDGTIFICDLELEGGKSESTGKIKFKDLEEYQRFWGASGAAGPLQSIIAQELEFINLSSELAFTATPYELRWTMHEVFIEEYEEVYNGRDKVEGSFKALLRRTETDNATTTLELVNTIPRY